MGVLVKHPTDEITYKIIGMAMEVHSRLGPGLKEDHYQKAMEEMLEREKVNYQPQRQVEVYLGKRLIGLLFIDIFVERLVIVELKALSHPVTNNKIAQVVTYLKTAGAEVGLLLNFGRKYLEYKRIFPPRKITELTERDLRFGVILDPRSAERRERRLKTQYIR